VEKGNGAKNSELKTIVVTGPESTGKTMISEYLSGQLGCAWIPEYAREYIGSLNRRYDYSDLVNIAEMQIMQKKEAEQQGNGILILDTWLIITKIWFEEVYGKVPGFLDREILENRTELFIVCMPDIPWVPDPLRENGGDRREYLLKRYISEIEKTGYPYLKLFGLGEARYLNALKLVKTHLNLQI
jgi:nicotinamide riboside kinase